MKPLIEWSKIDERLATIVELRYSAGLSLEEAAEAVKVSRATAPELTRRNARKLEPDKRNI